MDRLELVYADQTGRRLGVKRAFAFDLAYGADENDFEIELAKTDSLPLHCYVWIEGTEWGGVVDGSGVDATGDVPVSKWTGRTWHGILSHSVVMPDGDDAYRMEGEANQAIGALIERQGLSGVFTASQAKSGMTLGYDVARYADAYTALKDSLASVGARLEVERRGGSVELSAVPALSASETGRGSLGFSASLDTRPVNHLVCAGEGQEGERTLVDLYADEAGNVSQTQSLFGIDEVAELYGFTTADRERLIEDGTKRLEEYQEAAASASLNAPKWQDLHIGDSVGFLVPETGFGLTAPVTKIVASVSSTGVPTVSYTLGDVRPIGG